jgi:hypothetical protein
MITKSVIPFAARFFAALIPETPPPRIATLVLVVFVLVGAAETASAKALIAARDNNFMILKLLADKKVKVEAH